MVFLDSDGFYIYIWISCSGINFWHFHDISFAFLFAGGMALFGIWHFFNIFGILFYFSLFYFLCSPRFLSGLFHGLITDGGLPLVLRFCADIHTSSHVPESSHRRDSACMVKRSPGVGPDRPPSCCAASHASLPSCLSHPSILYLTCTCSTLCAALHCLCMHTPLPALPCLNKK